MKIENGFTYKKMKESPEWKIKSSFCENKFNEVNKKAIIEIEKLRI